MKKILLLISSLLAVLALIAVPLACSHDDDDSGTGDGNNVQLVIDTVGFLKYGSAVKDSANVSIVKESNGKISLTIETGIPYLTARFSDVNVTRVSGDTSYFHATEDLVDPTQDKKMTRILDGFMLLKEKSLYIQIKGADLDNYLYFSSDKSMLGAQEESKDSLSGKLTPAHIDTYCNEWSASAVYDSAAAIQSSFKTALTEDGQFSVDLGACKFSEKAPEMNIVLNGLTFVALDGVACSFSGSSANFTMGSVTGSLPADVKGSCNGEVMNITISLTVGKTPHTIVLNDCRIKK